MLVGALPARYLTARRRRPLGPDVVVPARARPPRRRCRSRSTCSTPRASPSPRVTVDSRPRRMGRPDRSRAQSGFSIVDHVALRRDAGGGVTRHGRRSRSGPSGLRRRQAVRLAARAQARGMRGATIAGDRTRPDRTRDQQGRQRSRAARRRRDHATSRRPSRRRSLRLPLPWDAPGLRLRAAARGRVRRGRAARRPRPVDELPADTAVPLRPLDVAADHDGRPRGPARRVGASRAPRCRPGPPSRPSPTSSGACTGHLAQPG